MALRILQSTISDRYYLSTFVAHMFRIQLAFVRDPSPRMEDALRMEEPSSPFRLDLMVTEHDLYVKELSSLVEKVVVVSGSPEFPDCVFIEVLLSIHYSCQR